MANVAEIQFVRDIIFPGDGYDVTAGRLSLKQKSPSNIKWSSNSLGVLIECDDLRPRFEGKPFQVQVFWNNIAAFYYSPSPASAGA